MEEADDRIPKWTDQWLATEQHTYAIVVVAPGELAGHLVLLEIRLSTDQ